MPFMPRFCFHRRQPLQDSTGVHGLVALAALTQLTELLLELEQLGHTHVDVGNVFVQ